MNIRLTQGIVGQHFNFIPKQIVSCDEKTAKDLIRVGAATRAPDGVETDGEIIPDTDEEISQAKYNKRHRFLLGQTHTQEGREALALHLKKAPERADMPEREMPERGTRGVCQAKTTAGNACKKAALPGKKFCAKHTDEI